MKNCPVILETRESLSNTPEARIIVTPRDNYKPLSIKRGYFTGDRQRAHDLAVAYFLRKNNLSADFYQLKTRIGYCYIPKSLVSQLKIGESENENLPASPANTKRGRKSYSPEEKAEAQKLKQKRDIKKRILVLREAHKANGWTAQETVDYFDNYERDNAEFLAVLDKMLENGELK